MDPNSTYGSQLEQTLTELRYGAGANEICQQRTDFPESGTQIAIIADNKGEMISQEHDILFGETTIKKKFYRVWFRNAEGKEVKGWISEDQLSKPTTYKEDTTVKPDPPPIVQPKEPECPPVGSNASNGVPEVKKQVEVITKNVVIPATEGAGRKIDHSAKNLSEFKSDSEIDRYMCLYRSGHDEASFKKQLARFKKSAKAAEESFGVPYALSMCFALTESSLKFESKGEYRGYGQFGSARVEDLKKALDISPYNQMWSNYRRQTDAPAFSDNAIRSVDSPEASIGAISFALRQMYGSLFKNKCADCSSATGDPKTANMKNINRKDLYLMIGGYNFTPSQIGKMGSRTTAGLASSFPPPEESRNYMKQMDNCLSKGEELRFRDASSEAANARRRRDIAKINKKKAKSTAEMARVKALQDLIAVNASGEYEDRVNECNRTHPK